MAAVFKHVVFKPGLNRSNVSQMPTPLERRLKRFKPGLNRLNGNPHYHQLPSNGARGKEAARMAAVFKTCGV